MTKSVIIVGGGISGLCCAHFLRQKGLRVTLLEKSSSPGGTMKTLHEEGWLIETGPNSALETTPLLSQLFSELGILGERVYADASASKRYIVKGGTLLPLPMSPAGFLSTRLWSAGAKLRLLREPFIARGKKEESIAEFVSRRLGHEFLDYAIDPFVSGVYAGDPSKLSVQSAFPKLYALEKNHGGLLKGTIATRRERKQRKEISKDRARLFSFVNGMETFPNAVARALGDSYLSGAAVDHIVPMRAGKYPVYTVSVTQNGERQTLNADAVVLASPAHATASLIRSIDPAMSATLEAIYYPPVAELFLGFSAGQVSRALDGFGFLVPRLERRNLLGSIWSSSLFAKRAPEGCVALTSFVGGARSPELVALDDDALVALVMDDLRSLLGVTGVPLILKLIRWERAIPQYNLGYHAVLSAIDRFEQNFQRAYICSNYRGGIAVGDCVMSAETIANRALNDLREIPSA